MTPQQHMRIINRQRRLPEQLAKARLRVRHLELEAERLGIREILEDPRVADRAWGREIELAKIGDVSVPVPDRSAA